MTSRLELAVNGSKDHSALSQRLKAIEDVSRDAVTYRNGLARFRPRLIFGSVILLVIVIAAAISTYFILEGIDQKRSTNAKEEIIKQATTLFFEKAHVRTNESQKRGNWDEAGGLLGALIGFSRAPEWSSRILDEFQFKLAQQWIYKSSPRGDYPELRSLDQSRGGPVRFQLRTSGRDRLHVVDTLTGIIIAQQTIPERLDTRRYFASMSRRQIIIKADSGQLYLWSLSSGSIDKIGLKLERGDLLLSVAWEDTSKRVAVLTETNNGRAIRILDGTELEADKAPQERQFEELERSLLGEQDRRSEIDLLGLHGSSLVAQFRLINRNVLAIVNLPSLRANWSITNPVYISTLASTSDGLAIVVKGDANQCNRDRIEEYLRSYSGAGDAPAGLQCLVFLELDSGKPWVPPLILPPIANVPEAVTVTGLASGELTYQLFFRSNIFWTKWEKHEKSDPIFDRHKSAVFGAKPVDETQALQLISDIHFSLPLAEDGTVSRPVQAALDATGQHILLIRGGEAQGLSFARGQSTGWTPQIKSRGCNTALTALSIPLVSHMDEPTFIALDGSRQIWKFHFKGKTDNSGEHESQITSMTEVVASCVAAPARFERILAVHPSTSRAQALFLTSSGELVIGQFDVLPDALGVRLDSERTIKTDIKPRLAAFLGERKLALLGIAGDLEIIEERDGLWNRKSYQKSFWQDITQISAHGSLLLLVAETGAAALVDAANVPRVIGAGVLPPRHMTARLQWDSTEGATIQAVYPEGSIRFKVPAVPPINQLGQLIAARYIAPAQDYVHDFFDLGGSLLEGRGRHQSLSHLRESGSLWCGQALSLLLDVWEESERTALLGDDAKASVRHLVSNCHSAQPSENEKGLVSRVVKDARSLSQDTDPTPTHRPAWEVRWQPTWSDLVATEGPGQILALRALALSLRYKGDAFARAAGDELLTLLEDKDRLISKTRLSNIEMGIPLTDTLLNTARASSTFDGRALIALGFEAARSSDDIGQLRRALVHFLLAERAYLTAGHTETARFAGRRRADLANALPDAEVQKALLEARDWEAQSEPLFRVSPGHEKEDEMARLRGDLERTEHLESNLGVPKGRPLILRFLILRRIADIQELLEPTSAATTYRDVANLLLENPDRVRQTHFEELLSALTDRLALSDPTLVFRLRLELVNLSTDILTPTNITSYIRNLRAASEPPQTTQSVLDGFTFPVRPFTWRTILRDIPPPALVQAFIARLAFVDGLLQREPNRADFIAQRGTTNFWLGMSLRQLAANERADRNALLEPLDAAIADFDRAERLGRSELEDKYIWANAHRLAYEKLPESDMERRHVHLQRAIELYSSLHTAIDRKEWRPFPHTAEFFSQYSYVLREQTLHYAHQLHRLPNRSALVRSVLDILYLSSEWDRTRNLAMAAPDPDWGVEPGRNMGVGLALGYLTGHTRLSGATAAVADNCDRLASHPFDPLRRTEGVTFDKMNYEDGVAACRAALERTPNDARAKYLLGRSLSNSKEEVQIRESTRLFVAAAREGYVAAFINLSVRAEDSRIADRFRLAYKQGVYLSLDLLLPELQSNARTAQDEAGLKWLSEDIAQSRTSDRSISEEKTIEELLSAMLAR